MLHTKRKAELANVIGGTEETTTGVIRLRAMAKEGVLQYPIIAVNDADTKHLFDNRYGTGQCTIDGIIRATNFLLAGLEVRGRRLRLVRTRAGIPCARRRRRSHRHRNRSDESARSRHGRLPRDAAWKKPPRSATFSAPSPATRTSSRKQHFELMKDGAIISNSGHFNVEIDIPALEKMSSSKRSTRDFVEEFTMKDGRRINLLGEGRLINLAAAEGHPASVMDMSFANQALSLRVHGEEPCHAGKEGLYRSR